MPTTSSGSEGTPRPRRRPSTRSASATRRPSARSRRTSDDVIEEAGETSPQHDDDFGSGVDERESRSARASSRAPEEVVPQDTEERRPRVRRERAPRRVVSETPTEGSGAVPEAGREDSPPVERADRGDRPGRSARMSNRQERQIADVESQAPMRYFSTEDLDFGDDDVPSRPSRRRDEVTDAAPAADSGRGRSDAEPSNGDRPAHRGGDRRDRFSDRGRGRQRSFGRGPDNRGPDNRGPDNRGPDNRGSDSRGERHDNRERAPRFEPAEGDRYPADSSDRLSSEASDFLDDFDSAEGEFSRAPEGTEGEAPRYSDGDRRPRRRRRRRRGGSESGPPRNDNRFQSGRGEPGRRGPSRGDGDRSRGRNPQRRDPRGGRDSGRMHDSVRRSRPIQPSGEVVEGTFDGVLELHNRGYGFLRDPKRNYAAEDSNPFVSSSLVEKYRLREGVLIRGDVGQGTRNQGPRLKDVELIDGFSPEEYAGIKHFDTLTAINPFEQIKLEIGPRPLTMRVMDLLCPIGKGQRALLVAPPRTGKTMLLQEMANSVSINHPEIHLMVLLIDERPEEVTEMRRMVKGEVISSSLDSDVDSHIRIAELIIERAKRLAEEGRDVFILLDSITRLARAFNKAQSTGRTGTGGLDIRALDIPKKLFGQARRFDEGGSLTVCGTALIDTGARMDEAIFQEFKGTGNMEMVLSRELADRRIWPSIDITKSGTRREEKILAPDLLEGITMLRRSLISLSPVEAMEQLTRTMEKFPTNREFLSRIKAVL